MPLTYTDDLWKTYRMGAESVHALSGVSVDIERGELVAITHEADIAQHAHRVIHLMDGAVDREDINAEPTEAGDVRVSVRTA